MMSAPSSLDSPPTAHRGGGVFGFALLVVLLLTAAAVSLPLPDASGQTVTAFHTQH